MIVAFPSFRKTGEIDNDAVRCKIVDTTFQYRRDVGRPFWPGQETVQFQ